MDIDPIRRNKKPRLLLESERERLDEFIDSIHYSARYETQHPQLLFLLSIYLPTLSH